MNQRDADSEMPSHDNGDKNDFKTDVSSLLKQFLCFYSKVKPRSRIPKVGVCHQDLSFISADSHIEVLQPAVPQKVTWPGR